ncbi:hypothetical protein [Streptomyces sp. Ac-502]|uniref:hypothetical protein n=1 Tax=Streptomyces sp. Ac-502 TaxID=3342801 RepID=UPI003862398B
MRQVAGDLADTGGPAVLRRLIEGGTRITLLGCRAEGELTDIAGAALSAVITVREDNTFFRGGALRPALLSLPRSFPPPTGSPTSSS